MALARKSPYRTKGSSRKLTQYLSAAILKVRLIRWAKGNKHSQT